MRISDKWRNGKEKMQDVVNRYPTVSTVMQTIASEFIAEYREKLAARSLSQSGALPDSMQPEIIADDAALHVAIALAEYWKWVEHGRGPGKQPPLANIEAWVEHTGFTGVVDSNNNSISTRSLAFLIARKIGREGTKGKGIVNDITTRNAEAWAARIYKAAAADVNSQARNIFSKLTTRK